MRKVFILLFISLALLSCQKEENNRKTEYQVLTSTHPNRLAVLERNVLLRLRL
jgi:uncharacterized protein YcfL